MLCVWHGVVWCITCAIGDALLSPALIAPRCLMPDTATTCSKAWHRSGEDCVAVEISKTRGQGRIGAGARGNKGGG